MCGLTVGDKKWGHQLLLDPDNGTDDRAIVFAKNDVSSMRIAKLGAKCPQFDFVVFEPFTRLLHFKYKEILLIGVSLVNQDIRKHSRGTQFSVKRAPWREIEALWIFTVTIVLNVDVVPGGQEVRKIEGKMVRKRTFRDPQFKKFRLFFDEPRKRGIEYCSDGCAIHSEG
jgi:hypothetical protein